MKLKKLLGLLFVFASTMSMENNVRQTGSDVVPSENSANDDFDKRRTILPRARSFLIDEEGIKFFLRKAKKDDRGNSSCRLPLQNNQIFN